MNKPNPASLQYLTLEGYALPSGYTLNKAQSDALFRVAKQWGVTLDSLLEGASQGFGNPATAELMVSPNGQIWLGIERDGYCHS